MFLWRRQEIMSRAERARRIHEAWLTQALASRVRYPRIPTRLADTGGFARLTRRQRGRDAADRWWAGTLDRLEAIDGE